MTGAAVATLAGFRSDDVTISPSGNRVPTDREEIVRTFCGTCGTPLSFQSDYLDGQTYIHISVLDSAADLVPTLHSYESRRLPWLHINDDAMRQPLSSRGVIDGVIKKSEGDH